MLIRFCLALLFVFSAAASAQTYVSAFERDQGIESGTELVMVYIGASHCGPCTWPEYKESLEQAKVLLSEQAEASGKAFVTVGVSIDYDPEVGYAFLNDSGRFDEMAMGRNWFNSAAVVHFGLTDGEEGRTLALPSIIVYERDMTMGASLGASEPRYLKQIVGATDLPAWVEAGAPVALIP